MAVGYIAYLSIKKLFSRNRMMATYFYVREVVIPRMEETGTHSEPKQNIIKYNEELLDNIKSMADFFEGELLRSIFRYKILT
jgi:hypothetical protein